jgi:chromosomal replication initiation ATPase DnaA
MLNTKSLWENFLKIAQERTNPVSFATWFKDISLISIDHEKVIIQVPMELHKNFLSTT